MFPGSRAAGHRLEDFVFTPHLRTPHPHHVEKMDAKDAFLQVAVEWNGCMKFGYVFGDFVVVDRRLVFGWRNSPGFYWLLAGAIEHAHGSTSYDNAVVTPQGLSATSHVRVDIPAAGKTRAPLPPKCSVPPGTGGGGEGHVLGSGIR